MFRHKRNRRYLQLRCTGLIMSIHVHKTGLNKTLGQQSDAVISTNLIGDFNIKFGQASSYWSNQVSGSTALRRYNGISLVLSSHPYYYQFDGTDDYLGAASSGYGGTAFTVAFQNAYTVGQWVYLPSSWGSGKKHVLYYIGSDSSNFIAFMIDNTTMQIHSYTSSGNYAPGSFSSLNLTNNRSKWLYHTVTHNGSGVYSYYVNGSFIGSINANYAPSATADEFNVGYFSDAYNETTTYTSAGVRVGHIHVHSSELTNSQIRQNYLASHDMNNVRYFGDTALG